MIRFSRMILFPVIILVLIFNTYEAPTAKAAGSALQAKRIIFNLNYKLFISTEGDVWTLGGLKPFKFPGLSKIVDVTQGDGMARFSFALKSDGTVWLMDGTPARIPGLPAIVAVTQGFMRGYALDASGHVWPLSNRVVKPSKMTDIKDVSAISSNSQVRGSDLYLKKDGTVWIRDDGMGPRKIAGLNQVKAIYAGLECYFALKKDGTVWSWGINDTGQLGDGTTIERKTPVQVNGLTDIVKIGDQIALKRDGTVWKWGDNSKGQLGDGSEATPPRYSSSNSKDPIKTPHPYPVQVKGLKNVKAVFGTFALKYDGTMWGWGDNSIRQIANTSAPYYTEPRQLALTSQPAPAKGKWTVLPANKLDAGIPNSAVQLSDGRIFLLKSKTSQIYNPANQSVSNVNCDFSWLGSYVHLVALHNGRALIASEGNGGLYATGKRIVAVYDPGTRACTRVFDGSGSIESEPYVLQDGRVVFGGASDYGGPEAKVQLYDPAANAWSTLPEMNIPRIDPVFSQLPDGSLLAAGGRGDMRGTYVERYDFTARKWAVITDPGINLMTASQIFPLNNGKVVLYSGMHFLALFDPAAQTFKEISIPAIGRIFAVSKLSDDAILITTTMENIIYNPNDGSFRLMAAEPSGFNLLAPIVLQDGRALYLGRNDKSKTNLPMAIYSL